MLGFPVLVVRLDFINGERYTSRQKTEMLEEAVDRLGEGVKSEVLKLAQSPEGPRSKSDGVILDILKTNGFGIDVAGVQHLGLYVEGSRVNHNCRPNAFWRYVGSQMAMEVVALRNIQPGEEVAHSYAPLGYTHEERKAVLRQWGFQCRCALCSAPPAERQLADSRRERILEIHQILRKASELQSTRRVDELVREAMTLIELEELHPQLVEYYAQFANAYIMINELKKARDYVQKADDMWLFYGGEEHENVEGMKELWDALEEAEREVESE
ncbi:SET domain-containing protein 5, partial [Cladorrhinum sp. PSN259]